ncbi:Protein mak11 [Batrachochytrium dendrobatidis]
MAIIMSDSKPLASDFLIIAGTYERLLYGLSCSTSPDNTITPVFIYPAHINCIKTVAAGCRFLATGSTDEHVKLYDLRKCKEVGTLMHHSGTITALAFYNSSHLMTASEDGTIGIVRSSDWELLKTLKGHTSSILSIAVHPSGKILLSVSKDKTLRCWDLMRGVCAYTLKLHAIAEQVVWSPSGSHYALLFSNSVIVYLVETGDVFGKFDSPRSRLNAISFTLCTASDSTKTEVIIIGGEDKIITVILPTGKVSMQWKSGHDSRIKDIAALVCAKRQTTVFATCSSDGAIFIWDLNMCHTVFSESDDHDDAQSKDLIPQKLCCFDTKCRLTCIALAEVDKVTINSSINSSKTDYPESDYEDVGIAQPKITVTMDKESKHSVSASLRLLGKVKKLSKKTVKTPLAKKSKTPNPALAKKSKMA